MKHSHNGNKHHPPIHRNIHHPAHYSPRWMDSRLKKRKNNFLQNLQASINLLSVENKKLLIDITPVNKEIITVRKENEQPKASIDRLCTENAQLKDEIRQLKEKLTK